MELSDFYVTVIDCSKYYIKIKETITVTVRLLNFNGNAVVGESVTISCDSKGRFDGSASYTGVTDSNGEISVTYTPRAWGNATLKCNEASVMVRIIGGQPSTNVATTGYNFNGSISIIRSYDMIGIGFNGSIASSGSPLKLFSFNSSLAPDYTYETCPSHVGYGQIIVNTSGEVYSIINSTGTNYQGIWYHKEPKE